MGSNTLNTRSAGETIVANFFNDFNTAMNGDFIGRNSSGVPTSLQNLGTVATPWGAIRGNTLVLDGSAIDVSTIVSPQNRVISGKVRTTSNQPSFITPNGAAASFVLDGTPVNLVVDVNGTEVTVTTDITKTSLTLAPSSQNTALLNDGAAAGQYATRIWGERGSGKDLTIDTAGTSVTALVGKWAAFKVAGGATEYLLAFVESSTKLSKVFRGFFVNSSLAPINRTTLTDNDVFTLMSLAWVFIENDGVTCDVTYNNPTWSFTSPSGPATGDYWYDFANDTWKRYDGASFQIINRTWVGMAIIDTANCVGARCTDFHAKYDSDNSLDVQIQSTEIVRSILAEARTSVAGNDIRFRNSLATWNITTDLAGSADMYSATEQASRVYYLYLTDVGDTVMSDISPYYRSDFLGLYHPHNPWRCVGFANNNASSNLLYATVFTLPLISVQKFTSGSGTYITPTNPVPAHIKVCASGGGGGGAGGGAGAGSGGTGGNTTFGTSLLTANGGGAGVSFGNASGGTATVASPAIQLIANTGGGGGAGSENSGTGGNITFQGGWGGTNNLGGSNGIANTGAGGSGGDSINFNITTGSGGGAGGYLEAIILPDGLEPSYAYAVGASGTAGAAGTSSEAGFAGGSGFILVEEFYARIIL